MLPLIEYVSAAFAGQKRSAEDLDSSSLFDRIEIFAPYARVGHAKAHEFRDRRHYPVDLGRALGIVVATGYRRPIAVEYEGD